LGEKWQVKCPLPPIFLKISFFGKLLGTQGEDINPRDGLKGPIFHENGT
jgi:hypothetical protein